VTVQFAENTPLIVVKNERGSTMLLDLKEARQLSEKISMYVEVLERSGQDAAFGD
jgi:hypothetical protein